MRPAFVALGEALIDAVTVGLIGDDKDAAVPQAAEAIVRTAQATNGDIDRMLHP